MSRIFVVLAVAAFLATTAVGCRLFSEPAEAAAGRDTGDLDTGTDAHSDIDAMPPEAPLPR